MASNFKSQPGSKFMQGDFRVGECLVHPSQNSVSRDGEAAQIEPRAMELLLLLAHSAGEVLSEESILQAVWPGVSVNADVLDRAVSDLRKAIGDSTEQPRYLQSIPNRGYRLAAPISRIGDPQVESLIAQGGWEYVEVNENPRAKRFYYAAFLFGVLSVVCGWVSYEIRAREASDWLILASAALCFGVFSFGLAIFACRSTWVKRASRRELREVEKGTDPKCMY